MNIYVNSSRHPPSEPAVVLVNSQLNPLIVRGIIGGAALLLPRVVPGFAWWPGYLLVPFLVTIGLSSAVPAWRGPWPWWSAGRWSRTAMLAGLIGVLGSSAALIFFDRWIPGRVATLARLFPAEVWRYPVLAGASFSLLNAFLEEAIYRGVLHDAIVTAVGWGTAVALTAVAFGLAHYYGFPSGSLGVAMATLYGLTMSGLRLLSGGLLLPVLAHACADGTIWWLLMHDSPRA